MHRKTIKVQAESIIKHIINALSLTSVSRASKRAVKDNAELVGAFKRALYQKIYQQDVLKEDRYIEEFVNSYKGKAVRIIKTADIALDNNDPILICVVKDDLTRIKAQVEHHKQLGVRHFAYVDNKSTDGTFEWLFAQDEVSLFTVDETFCTGVKNAWVRQVMDILGYNRWYLKIDSDELFVYPGSPGIGISQYIDFLETKGIKAVSAPMIDMYSSGRLFGHVSEDDFQNEYSYFDTDTYIKHAVYHTQNITGGPRRRLFGLDLQLAKYPLIKAQASFLLLDHSNYPRFLNFQTNGAAAFLLHYKFLNEDYDKFKEYIESGVHVNKSRDQMKYIQVYDENPDITFLCEGSQKLTSSMDLLKINICDQGFFEELMRICDASSEHGCAIMYNPQL